MSAPATPFNTLAHAHRGYDYQDVATAYFLIQALYHDIPSVIVDRKQYAEDIFDDLTVTQNGREVRRQFKSSNPAEEFCVEHLKTKIRDLRLDDLVSSFANAPHPANE